MENARLAISRTDDTAGGIRRVQVLVDGRTAGYVRPGETVELEVEPGVHEVQTKMDWTTSPPLTIDAAAGTTTHLRTTFPWSALWNMILSPRTTLLLEQIH
ncbi:hypothetical protein [Cellulomonas sp. RIT-PI-Y]|uniref:hypothetical protein n=1 Tax=Cellulomonas sp. RIT-PI-Y TaxID=3035297 RepID=UPI0021D7D759|nr:hypothetical protein [Cellulomonas sp. RIT-PI-Y]